VSKLQLPDSEKQKQTFCMSTVNVACSISCMWKEDRDKN